VDQRAFYCWAISKDPSKIPQTVYLSIAKKDSSAANPHVHFVRPRQAIHCNVFRILIHIDAIEDLMLYHFPREDLVAGGKIPWWEFNWQFGRADRDLGEEVMHPLLDFVGRLGHSSEGLIEMMMTKTKSWGVHSTEIGLAGSLNTEEDPGFTKLILEEALGGTEGNHTVERVTDCKTTSSLPIGMMLQVRKRGL
jgi:hypothetical protein